MPFRALTLERNATQENEICAHARINVCCVLRCVLRGVGARLCGRDGRRISGQLREAMHGESLGNPRQGHREGPCHRE